MGRLMVRMVEILVKTEEEVEMSRFHSPGSGKLWNH